MGRDHRIAGRQGQRTAGQCCKLPGDAGQAQAISTIGRELDGEQGVIERQILTQVSADGRILRQDQQAAAFLGNTQFLGRTQHAEGLNATQLGRLDAEPGQVCTDEGARNPDTGGGVGCAANNLQQLALPRVHLADTQLVGIGVFFGLDDLRDHHLGKHSGHAVLLFHFQPRHGEQMAQRIRIEVRTDETAQPEF